MLFLEAPGPQVRLTKTISLTNDDPSAKNLRAQLNEAEVELKDIMLWNIVPWIRKTGVGFDVPSMQDIVRARKFHQQLFNTLPLLRTVVFVGKKAQRDMVFYSGCGNYRLLAAHHPSAQAMVIRTRWDDNVAVFRRINMQATRVACAPRP